MDVSNIVIPGGSAAFGVLESPPVPENSTAAGETSQNTAAQNGTTQQEQPPSGTAQTSEQTPTPLTDILNSYYTGGTTLSNVAGVLLTEMPVIPVCYRRGLVFIDNSISTGSGTVAASKSDIFISAEDWICLEIKK